MQRRKKERMKLWTGGILIKDDDEHGLNLNIGKPG
jgi:hypothetical protein